MKTIELTKTSAITEQHLHGAFGVDFLNCSVDDLLWLANELIYYGVSCFYPTLATAPIDVLIKQIKIIKQAMQKQSSGAKILGVNLEACFLNPEKKGIHAEKELLEPTIENYKLIEDNTIKIVTIAPELDKDFKLTRYLKIKGIKVFAGHTMGVNLSEMDGVTHIFNAMDGITHKRPNTVASALIDDKLFTEIILDGYHVDYQMFKLVFKCKPLNKIILISDALPITHSDLKEMNFCSKKIHIEDGVAKDDNGTIAGSNMLIVDIIRKLIKNRLSNLYKATTFASNSNVLFNTDFQDYIWWDKDLNIVKMSIQDNIIFEK